MENRKEPFGVYQHAFGLSTQQIDAYSSHPGWLNNNQIVRDNINAILKAFKEATGQTEAEIQAFIKSTNGWANQMKRRLG